MGSYVIYSKLPEFRFVGQTIERRWAHSCLHCFFRAPKQTVFVIMRPRFPGKITVDCTKKSRLIVLISAALLFRDSLKEWKFFYQKFICNVNLIWKHHYKIYIPNHQYTRWYFSHQKHYYHKSIYYYCFCTK